MLLLVFLISIAVLLLCIIKIKLNPFVALLVCAYGTGLLALATYVGGTAPEGFASIADVTVSPETLVPRWDPSASSPAWALCWVCLCMNPAALTVLWTKC